MKRLTGDGGPGFAAFQQAIRHHKIGKMRDAAMWYTKAVAAEPMNGALLYQCGSFAVEVGDHQNAEVYLGRAAATPWGSQEDRVWHSLGVALAKNENLPHAEEAHLQAVALNPRNVLAWIAAGVLAMQANDPESGRRRWAHALTLTPKNQEDRYAQAQVAAMLGDYTRAWPLWESRLLVKRVSGYAPPTPGFWNGKALRGKTLLVVGEGGYGDEIHFARFLPALAAQHDGPLVLCVRSGNVDLYNTFPGITRVESRAESFKKGDAHPAPEAVAQVKMWSLPLRLGMTTPASWPEPKASLPPDLDRWRPRSAQGDYDTTLRLGFCWRGSQQHGNDYDRSAPTRSEMLDWLKQPFPDATWLNFTQGDEGYVGGSTWRETATRLRALDALVTVDTAIAHVALALGLPTVVIVPGSSEWRWGLDHRSPWYPNAVLVRKQGCYAGGQPYRDAATELVRMLG